MSTQRKHTFKGWMLLAIVAGLAAPAAGWGQGPARRGDRPDPRYADIYGAFVADERQPLAERIKICERIGQLGAQGKAAEPSLLKVLRSAGKEWQVEEREVDLGDGVCVPVYHARLLGPDLRLAALAALQAIGAEPRGAVVAALGESLWDLNRDYEMQAPYSTGELPIPKELGKYIPEDPAPGAPRLVMEFEKVDTEIEKERGGNPYLIGNRLRKYAGQKYARLGSALAKALEGYGPKAREAIPFLIEVARGEQSADLLPRSPDQPAPVKGKKLAWADARCRAAAVEALGAVARRDDADAVSALRGIAALDDDLKLAQAAEQALKGIEARIKVSVLPK